MRRVRTRNLHNNILITKISYVFKSLHIIYFQEEQVVTYLNLVRVVKNWWNLKRENFPRLIHLYCLNIIFAFIFWNETYFKIMPKKRSAVSLFITQSYCNLLNNIFCIGKSLCRTWGKHVVYKNCSEYYKQFLYTTCLQVWAWNFHVLNL